MRNILFAAPAALAVAACGGGTEAPAETDQTAMTEGTDEPTLAERDTDTLDGSAAGPDGMEWTSKPIDGDPAMLFGPPQAEAVFTVRCVSTDGSLAMLGLTWMAKAEAGEGQMVTLRQGSLTGTLEMTGKAGEMSPHGYLTGETPAEGPIATVLAGVAAPIEVSIEDGSTLTMPANADLRALIGNCDAD